MTIIIIIIIKWLLKYLGNKSVEIDLITLEGTNYIPRIAFDRYVFRTQPLPHIVFDQYVLEPNLFSFIYSHASSFCFRRWDSSRSTKVVQTKRDSPLWFRHDHRNLIFEQWCLVTATWCLYWNLILE